MIKYFCDCCGQEVTDDNKMEGTMIHMLPASATNRRNFVTLHITASITLKNDRGYNNEPDPEHVCRYCVTDALVKLDKRPKSAIPKKVEDLSADELSAEIARRDWKLAHYPGMPPLDPDTFGLAVPRPLQD